MNVRSTISARFGSAVDSVLAGVRAILGSERGEFDPRGAIRLGLYAGMGVLVGLVVAGLELVAVEVVLGWVLDAPLWLQASAPGVGVVAAMVILRVGRASPATSDDYITAFHSGARLRTRSFGPRLGAATATIGGGGAVGLEGPSIYAGAFLGQRIGTRFRWLLGPDGGRTLLVAGAAAGVSAVFKAPATGVLFALEAPYQRDTSAAAIIPSLVASAAAYLSLVSVLGTERFLPVAPSSVPLRDEILGALLVGVLAGLSARVLATLFNRAKDLHGRHRPVLRASVGAAILAAVVLAVDSLVEVPVSLGPGAEHTIEVVTDPSVGVGVIGALFVLRALATTTVLGAGGVGGVFIPLVVQGLLLGRLIESLVGAPSTGLYPAIGLAAVLGAGYRVPLAAVMFVAETTGQAGFVIPALLATAVSQALMGSVSVASGQVGIREGLLERRLRLPVSAVTIGDIEPVLIDKPLSSIVDDFAVATPPSPAIPVVDVDGTYCGLLHLRDIATVMFNKGFESTVADALTEASPVDADLLAADVAQRMADENTAVLPVCDPTGRPIGVVTAISLSGLSTLRDADPDGQDNPEAIEL